MKKRLLLIACIAILLCLAFAISICAEDVVLDGVTYATSDNSNFEGYNGSATVKSATAEIVTIPDFITTDSGNKYVVNAIATGAFKGNKTVKEIRVLSDYITKIPENFVNNTSSGGALEKAEIKAFDLFGNEVPVPEYKLEDKFLNMPCQLEGGFDNVYEMLTLDANMDVMAILDAVMKSNESKKEEKISD